MVEQRATHLPNKQRVTPKHQTSMNMLEDTGVKIMKKQYHLVENTVLLYSTVAQR